MYFGKDVKVSLKGQAKEAYLELKRRKDKEAKSILNSIERFSNLLKQNPQYGQPVPKRLFPKELVALGVENIYRIELPNYWRMLYTLEGNRVEIFVIVLSIVDHKEYDKLFGYK